MKIGDIESLENNLGAKIVGGAQIKLLKNEMDFADGVKLTEDFDNISKRTQLDIFLMANNHTDFSLGLCYGLGIFLKSKNFDPKVLNLMIQNDSLSILFFGLGLGKSFVSLEQADQDRILELAQSNERFGEGLGEGLGKSFVSLEQADQDRILELAQSNERFGEGLGEGLGKSFVSLEQADQDRILELAQSNERFGEGLGEGLGCGFSSLAPSITEKEKNLEIQYNTSEEFRFHNDVDNYFTMISVEHQKKIIDLIANKKFSGGSLGISIGRSFSELDPSLKNKILQHASDENMFSLGLGDGIGDCKQTLSEEEYDEISKVSKNNPKFDLTFLDSGDGFEACKHLWDMGIPSENFEDVSMAGGLTSGRFYPMRLNNDRLVIKQYCEDLPTFSYWLGFKLSQTFSRHSKELQQEIISFAFKNIDFMRGFKRSLNLDKFFVAD